MPVSIRQVVMRYPRLSLGLIFFAVNLALILASTDGRLFGDSKNYWRLALEPADAHYRGFAFPFLLFITRKIAGLIHISELGLFYVFNCASIAFLTCGLFPKLFDRLRQNHTPTLVTAIAGILVTIFWHGYFEYPLSDFPALIFATGATILLIDAGQGKSTPLPIVAAGVLMALAANTRPIYLISLVIMMIAITVLARRQASDWSFARKSAFFILGALIVVIPQVRIDQQSPVPLPSASEKYLQQLYWGVGISHYEAWVNRKSEAETAVLYINKPEIKYVTSSESSSVDPRLQISSTTQSVAGYLRLIIRHPRIILIGVPRHIFGGMDLRTSNAYPSRFAPRSASFAALNFLVIFAFLTFMLSTLRNRSTWKSLRITAIVLIVAPCLFAIPTGIETRFLLPLFFFAYFVAASFVPNAHQRIRSVPIWKIATLGGALAVWLVLCFFLADNEYHSAYELNGTPQELNAVNLDFDSRWKW